MRCWQCRSIYPIQSIHNITGYAKVPRDGDSILSLIIRIEDKYSRQDLKLKYLCVSSGFRRVLGESCAVLGLYAASSGYLYINKSPTFKNVPHQQQTKEQQLQYNKKKRGAQTSNKHPQEETNKTTRQPYQKDVQNIKKYSQQSKYNSTLEKTVT